MAADAARPPTALIIGGGIGGLTAAVALRRIGVEVAVFEQAGDVRKLQVGGGIMLWHNAMRALLQVDLAEPMTAAGAVVEREEFWTWRGEVIADWPVGEMGRRLGAPAVGVLRSNLHAVLLDAVGDGSVHAGARCTAFVEDERGVTAHFADGRHERGDLLVGADGLNSVIRRHVLGETPLRYAGYSAWQGVAPFTHPLVPPGGMRHLWGRGARFTFLPVGRDQLYWFGYANSEPSVHDIDAERLSPAAAAEEARGRKEAALARYSGWQEPTEAIIAATDAAAIRHVDVHDRAPVTRWGQRRVTLLGDAAHPMTITMGQGACQAIEDAVVLAKCIEQERNVVTAVREYERRRIERTTAFTNMAWRVGRFGRLENPVACWARERAMKVLLKSVVLKRHAKDMDFQP